MTQSIKRLFNPPRASVTMNSATSFTSGAFTACTWDTVDYDIDVESGLTPAWRSSGVSSQLTCHTAGLYEVKWMISMQLSGTGYRTAQLRINGAVPFVTVASSHLPSATASDKPVLAGSIDVRLAEGDYLEMFVFQNSGGALFGQYPLHFQTRYVAAY